MTEKPASLKVKKLKTPTLEIDGLEFAIGKLLEEEEWAEPMGPTPKPEITDLRSWDRRMLERYKPYYMPFLDICPALCTYGPCDLSAGKKGACGLDINAQASRIVLLACCMGASAHGAHGRHLLDHLIEERGSDYPIDLGDKVEVEAPLTRLIVGIKPKTLGDLVEAQNYVEEQITHCVSSAHTGQEGDNIDYESKALHVSMCDSLAMEIADLAQIVGYDLPKGEPDVPLIELGAGTIDRSKPVILVIGHKVAAGAEIADYLQAHDLYDDIELCGICCTALDISRYSDRAKVVGAMYEQIKFIRSGLADVIMVDEQCVRTDILDVAKEVKTPVLATLNKMALGLKDRTHDSVDQIVSDLVSYKEPGALILEPNVSAEVAVKLVMAIAPERKKFKVIPDMEEFNTMVNKCINCELCKRACPLDLDIPAAMTAAKQGDLQPLAELHDVCIGCVRCEGICREGIDILSVIEKAAEKYVKEEKYKVRAGRGPITDVEIRDVGAPIVLGEIPGVVAIVGCPNYPNGASEIGLLAEEFLKRRYIVVASGCGAMDIGKYRDEEGQTLYEKYPGYFDAGGLVNVGSCVSNAHIDGAVIKIANIFARRPLRGNYEEIADYSLNRVGAVGVAWGAMSQKAASIGTGANRLGIPVIVGPHGGKYRRFYMGRSEKDEDWNVYNARTGEEMYVGPAPEHLIYGAESIEECIVATAKLCLRPNDTTKGRAIKLTHYIDLHQKYIGTFPDDVYKFVRTEADIPITMKDKVIEHLKEKGWEPSEVPDPTLLPRLIRKQKT
jgi:acetyl-CoA decarbonylase/synthase complex subunit alpha